MNQWLSERKALSCDSPQMLSGPRPDLPHLSWDLVFFCRGALAHPDKSSWGNISPLKSSPWKTSLSPAQGELFLCLNSFVCSAPDCTIRSFKCSVCCGFRIPYDPKTSSRKLLGPVLRTKVRFQCALRGAGLSQTLEYILKDDYLQWAELQTNVHLWGP